CEFVKQRVLVFSGESLREVQVFVGATELAFTREVSSVHDKSAAFPVAARITQPVANVRWKMRTAIERNHASIVDDLEQQDHVSWCLQDLVIRGERPELVAVVETWK